MDGFFSGTKSVVDLSALIITHCHFNSKGINIFSIIMHNSGSQQEMVKLSFLVTVKPSVKNVCLIFLITLLVCVMTGKVLGCPLVTCNECARNMHRALCERTKNLNDVNMLNDVCV